STVTSFLALFEGREVSQRDLAEGLERFAPPGRAAEGQTRFTDGGYFATPGSLRETDDAGSAVILDADVPQFCALVAAGQATDGRPWPGPDRAARGPARPGPPSWLPVADASRSSPRLGFDVTAEEA